MGAGHHDVGSQAASTTAAASIASRSSCKRSHPHKHRKHTGIGHDTASASASANASTFLRHPKRRTEDASEDIDRLLESEGEEGVDMIKVVERQDVFHLLHEIRKDLRATIDTHLSWEELTSVDLNFTVVRPLAIKYSGYRSIAILYCLLLNRIYFQREASRDLAFQSVNLTRASLCELLSIKLLRTFSNDGLELVTALSASFHPLSGATEAELADLASASSVISEDEIKQGGLPAEQFSSTLELAIMSKAKKFISSPLCQRCIDGIWSGKVVLSPVQAAHAIVNDSYKRRPLSIYDPAKAPLLNHLRLRVPRIRNTLEFFNFLVILLLFVLALAQKGSPTWTMPETLFTIWLLGFTVDEVAQLQERGMAHYLTSFYNLLDSFFCLASLFWLGLRISALRHDLPDRSNLSFDCLALGAVLLCPRVASSLVRDNVVMLSLKAMISDFAFFTVLAMVCFSGFAYAFWSLASEPRWTFKAVLWLMLKVWFGSSYLGFDEASSFTLEFGPPLMILYTILSNTLLLTVLISLLSNTFQVVAMNAGEEAMYQFACKTMAGITTDAIFSYQPPMNLIAVVIVMPLSYVLSPRWLHKTNVFLIRLTSFPVLLGIRFFELHSFGSGVTLTSEKSRSYFSWMPIINSSLDGWGGNGAFDVIEAAFEYYTPCVSSDSETDGGHESDSGSASADQHKRERVLSERRVVEGSWEERAAQRFDDVVSASLSRSRDDGTKDDSEDETSRSADITGKAVSNGGQHRDGSTTVTAGPVAEPTEPRVPSTSGANRKQPQRPKANRLPRKGYEARGLGSLSSPLAKLYGRYHQGDPQGLSKDDQGLVRKSKKGRAGKTLEDESTFTVSAAESDGEDGTGSAEQTAESSTFPSRPSESEQAVGREDTTQSRYLMDKLREMESRNKRIEDLLLRILEEKQAS